MEFQRCDIFYMGIFKKHWVLRENVHTNLIYESYFNSISFLDCIKEHLVLRQKYKMHRNQREIYKTAFCLENRIKIHQLFAIEIQKCNRFCEHFSNNPSLVGIIWVLAPNFDIEKSRLVQTYETSVQKFVRGSIGNRRVKQLEASKPKYEYLVP